MAASPDGRERYGLAPTANNTSTASMAAHMLLHSLKHAIQSS